MDFCPWHVITDSHGREKNQTRFPGLFAVIDDMTGECHRIGNGDDLVLGVLQPCHEHATFNHHTDRIMN